jgi:signal transduction histidine kinase
MALDVASVLHFSQALQTATTLGELVTAAQVAVKRSTGYATTWLAVYEEGPPRATRILGVSGSNGDRIWEEAPIHYIDGDPMLEELFSADAGHPVVVIDARTDPRTNKATVEFLGNRTLINVPVLLGARRLASLGMGTFGAEGVRPPTADQLETLVVFATLLASAYLRIKVQADQERMRQRLLASQRLESVALLAGGVAHDFNNLLAVILNSATFLGDGPLTADQRACLADVVGAADRARGLTSKLLALGRRQELNITPVELAPLLLGLERILRRLLPSAVSLVMEVPNGLPQTLVDPAQLEQVILNLVVNARDAMPGGGSITVRAAAPAAAAELVSLRPRLGAGCVRISVIDTGQGMPPEVQERILEPFFTTKPSDAGTGLGLPVAAAIVDQHGGHLTCASEVGRGTTFELWLPAQPAAPVQTQSLAG